MFNYSNGKKLATLGFAANIVAVVLYYVGVTLRYLVYRFFGLPAFEDALIGIIRALLIIGSRGTLIALFGAAVGFGVMWLSEKKALDFLLAGALLITVLADFLLGRFIPAVSSTVYLVITAITAIFYLLLAIRVKDNNPMLAMLLGCAFLFQFVSPIYYNFIVPNFFALPDLIEILIFVVGNIVCAGLCFIAAKQE